MSSLPPAIFFINGDISYPAEPPPNPPDLDVFIGAEPNNPTSYIASPSELTTLQIQLLINDTMTKAEFDARMIADPNYATIIHLRGLRILVILPDFHDYVNRKYADVVMFLHQGMADILTNRFRHCEEPRDLSRTYPAPNPIPYPHQWHNKIAVGPPGQCYDLQRLNMYALLKAADDHCSVILPFETMPHCEECDYPYYCPKCYTFSGIKICRDCCGDCCCGCGLIDNQGRRLSPVYLPNEENEAHNYNFIHRK